LNIALFSGDLNYTQLQTIFQKLYLINVLNPEKKITFLDLWEEHVSNLWSSSIF